MHSRPYPFQNNAQLRAQRFRGRPLLALDMGLGKTFISLLHRYRNANLKPVVVVCPAVAKFVWETEAQKHFGYPCQILSGKRGPFPGQQPQANILIVNYTILGAWLDWLKYQQPQIVIIDECQAVANRRTQQTQNVVELCQGVPHILPLSGTPFVNRVAELWSILNIIRPDLYPSFVEFAEAYCEPVATPWGIRYDGSKHAEQLHAKLNKECLVRYKKDDVLKDLPAKRHIVVPVPIDNRPEYERAVTDFLGWLASYDVEAARRARRAEDIAKLNYLKQLVGILKLHYVCDWITNFLEDTDGKLVVFAIHREIINSLVDHHKKICGVVRLDGSASPASRKAAVDQFQQDRQTRLFVGQLQAAGTAITLTAAHTAAFAEIGWTPGAHLQAADRLHRIGQTKQVDVNWLVAHDTIDTKLCQLIQAKQNDIEAVLDGHPLALQLNIVKQLTNYLRNSNVQSHQTTEGRKRSR